MIERLNGLLVVQQHVAIFFAEIEAACSCEVLRMPERAATASDARQLR